MNRGCLSKPQFSVGSICNLSTGWWRHKELMVFCATFFWGTFDVTQKLFTTYLQLSFCRMEIGWNETNAVCYRNQTLGGFSQLWGKQGKGLVGASIQNPVGDSLSKSGFGVVVGVVVGGGSTKAKNYRQPRNKPNFYRFWKCGFLYPKKLFEKCFLWN